MAKLNSGTRIYGNVTVDTFITATGNVTGGNILTAGLISATGNITGNFFIGNGSQLTGIAASSYGNANVVANLAALGSNPVSTTGNITGGNLLTGGLISATGNITGGNLSGTSIVGTLTTASQTNITSVGTLGSLAVTGNTTGGNLLTGGLISATGTVTGSSFSGAGTGLTGTAASLTVGTATTAGTVTTAAQGNITSVGILTSLSSTGNITGGNVLGGANVNATTHTGTTVSVSGNITGGNILGGANVNATTHTGTTVSVSGNITGGNLSGTSILGTLTTAAQTNITSVGTLTALAVTGNITGGNVLGGANVNATTHTGTTVSVSGNVTGGNLITTGTANAATHTGTLVSVTGNITGGNLNTLGVGTFGNATPSAQLHVEQGSGSNIAYFRGNNAAVNSKVTLETTSNTSSIALTLINSGIGVAKQASFYLTSAGHISFQTNQTVGGEPTTGNAALVINTDSSITVNSGSATTAIVNGAANGVGNIGSSTVYFNTVFAKATSAQYADLAEKYTTDAEYAPGTVLSFGGSQEVTVTLTDADHRVAGVVSTNPATIMNAGLTSKHVATVALTGRVPCSVTGTVRKGDSMVSAGNGVARAEAKPAISTVIGKSLEDFDGELGMIEIVVGRV